MLDKASMIRMHKAIDKLAGLSGKTAAAFMLRFNIQVKSFSRSPNSSLYTKMRGQSTQVESKDNNSARTQRRKEKKKLNAQNRINNIQEAHAQSGDCFRGGYDGHSG
jgi:hypothetical protein